MRRLYKFFGRGMNQLTMRKLNSCGFEVFSRVLNFIVIGQDHGLLDWFGT